MESEESVEIDDRVARDVDGRPHRIVGALGVRHDDIEAVGCAALENDDQALVLGARRLSRVRCAREECGNGCRAYDSEAAVSQEYPPCD